MTVSWRWTCATQVYQASYTQPFRQHGKMQNPELHHYLTSELQDNMTSHCFDINCRASCILSVRTSPKRSKCLTIVRGSGTWLPDELTPLASIAAPQVPIWNLASCRTASSLSYLLLSAMQECIELQWWLEDPTAWQVASAVVDLKHWGFLLGPNEVPAGACTATSQHVCFHRNDTLQQSLILETKRQFRSFFCVTAVY